VPTLIIKTNASQATDVLIKDLGFLVPNSGGSVTFTDIRNLQDCNTSVNLRTLTTDNAFGANSSTLILNNGVSDIPQAQASDYLGLVAGIQGSTGVFGVTGIFGQTGLLGTNGQTGIRGNTGTLLDGLTGNTGTFIIGVTGILGFTGFQSTGVQGITGVHVSGFTGLDGSIGITGLAANGVTGLTIVGLTGPTGVRGLTGFNGATGFAVRSQIIGATGAVSTTATVYPDFASTGLLGTALIPTAGTYIVTFSSWISQASNNSASFIIIYQNGNQIINSQRQWGTGSGGARGWVGTEAIVTVNGSEIVDVRWRGDTANSATMTQRNMIFMKTGDGVVT
jgi:hypothetical protein